MTMLGTGLVVWSSCVLFGLVDGLPAPRPAQVGTEGLAQVGQRHLPLRPEVRDLPPDNLFNPHYAPCVNTCDDREILSLTKRSYGSIVVLQLSLSSLTMTDR